MIIILWMELKPKSNLPGQRVKQDFHLMEAYDMTLEATITKLMVLMGTCKGNYTAICDGFYKTVNYDLLSR